MGSLEQIERKYPLQCSVEDDARGVWPMRWQEAMALVFRLKADNRELKGRISKLLDELLAARKGGG